MSEFNQEPAKKTPLKRSKALQPLSHDHHHGLLLSWKIRAGLKKGVSPDRIGRYIDWFSREHLLPHFALEEKYFFPVLGNNHLLVKRALSEHQRLKTLLEDTTSQPAALKTIADELEAHIRFEERVLFTEIQNNATEAQLNELATLPADRPFVENGEDIFWE